MRPFAALALLTFAAPVAAGPLDAVEFRATFRFDSGPGVGPAQGPNQTAYPLNAAPLFGAVVSGTPEWQPLYRPYPGADFAHLSVGFVTPYIAGDLPTDDVYVSTRYAFDFELRDAAGRVAVLPLHNLFSAGWSRWGGLGYPEASQGSVRLGDTRYDVTLNYETSPVFYQDFGSGTYFPMRYPPPLPVVYRDGDYTFQSGGMLYVTVTPTPEPIGTPEPGTLALAAIGFGGLVMRRLRR